MSFNLTPGPEQIIQTFTGTPTQSVRLCSVQVDVTKTFQTSTSGVITILAPLGTTIQTLISCAATIFPGPVTIVTIAGELYIQFNATIWFTVQLNNNSVVLLSQTVTVQGDLGPAADVKVVPPLTTPTLTCINTGLNPGGVSVFGQIQVAAFNVEACELKSVQVVLDPDVPNPVDNPIDPI